MHPGAMQAIGSVPSDPALCGPPAFSQQASLDIFLLSPSLSFNPFPMCSSPFSQQVLLSILLPLSQFLVFPSVFSLFLTPPHILADTACSLLTLC